jgi:hypothetical protein
MTTIFQQVAFLMPVITGNRYSDLISSAAYHERAAFLLIEVAPGMAENHARAAAADRDSAAEWSQRPTRYEFTAIESGMPFEAERIAKRLDAAGLQGLWAGGAAKKGDGFWVRGWGYRNYSNCMDLLRKFGH